MLAVALISAWMLALSNAPDDVALPADFVSAAVPEDLNPEGGGAPAATLEQAAVFAWREFVALNWPAAPGGRETPLARDFGTPAEARVWETFRGRVETYPGTGKPFRDGSSPKSYGYDEPPR